MKNLMFPCKLASLLLLSSTLFFASCKEDKIQDIAGLTSFKLVMEGGQTFDCVIDHAAATVSNTSDSLPFGTKASDLNMKISYTTNTGASMTYNGAALDAEKKYDFAQPVKFTVSKGTAKVEYTVKAVVATVAGGKVVGDMTATGLPKFNSYTSAFFKGAFYIFGAKYAGGSSTTAAAEYGMYRSVDGVQWAKVTMPADLGGWGTQLYVFKDKLYGFGGRRDLGALIEGEVAPKDRERWRSFSTTDGVSFVSEVAADAVALGPQQNVPSGRAYPLVCDDGKKLYLSRGKQFGYGQAQNISDPYIWTSLDGKVWQRTAIDPNAQGKSANRADNAMVFFNGKIWFIEGSKGSINDKNVLNNIWSTDLTTTLKTVNIYFEGKDVPVEVPALTAVEEAATVASLPAMYGIRAIVSNGAIWLMGGASFDAGNLVMSNKIYRSTDAKTWVEVEAPVGYVGRTAPGMGVVAANGKIYIIGGQKSTGGTYNTALVDPKDELYYDIFTMSSNQ